MCLTIGCAALLISVGNRDIMLGLPRRRDRQIKRVGSVGQRRKAESCVEGCGLAVDGVGEYGVSAHRGLSDRFDRVEQKCLAEGKP